MGLKYTITLIIFIILICIPLFDYMRASKEEKQLLKAVYKTRKFKTMMILAILGYLFAQTGKNIAIYVITYVGLVMLAIVALVSIKNIKANETFKDFRVALCIVFLIFLFII